MASGIDVAVDDESVAASAAAAAAVVVVSAVSEDVARAVVDSVVDVDDVGAGVEDVAVDVLAAAAGVQLALWAVQSCRWCATVQYQTALHLEHRNVASVGQPCMRPAPQGFREASCVKE